MKPRRMFLAAALLALTACSPPPPPAVEAAEVRPRTVVDAQMRALERAREAQAVLERRAADLDRAAGAADPADPSRR